MGRTKSHPVVLSTADRDGRTRIVRTGSAPTQQGRRARILLELDENHPNREWPAPTHTVIAERAGACVDTIVKVSKAYADRGGDAMDTVTRKKCLTPPVEVKITGDIEARLITLGCTKPPEGYERWTLQLLEKHVLLTDGTPALDHSSIGRVLKRRNFSLT